MELWKIILLGIMVFCILILLIYLYFKLNPFRKQDIDTKSEVNDTICNYIPFSDSDFV